MVDRLIRVALIAQAEADFQHISHLFATLDTRAYRLVWFRDYETALGALEPTQYDVCLVVDETVGRNGAMFDTSHRPPPNVPMILLCHHGPLDTLRMEVMDWLPISGLSAAHLERSIRYVIERHLLLEALRVAQDAADSAQRMQGAFLAIMSDEIQTPINGVIGMAELLMETELTAEQHEYATIIWNSGRLLSTVINDILDMSKLKAGCDCLEQKAFKLHDLVDGVMTLFADHVQHKGLDFKWSICEDIPEVLIGDPSLLQQLLINLIGNAVKFTHAGHIDIRVMLDDETEDQVMICFQIEDTGIGIPLELHDRMFQQFSPGDTSNSRQQGGAGLGLAIARHIANAMNGSITFESQPTQGSTFWCQISLLRPTSS